MKPETIASVGATIIALLALVASQFPPLYTYFQNAHLEVSTPSEFVLRCSPRGVFVSLRLPIQNTGDAYGEIASLQLEITDNKGDLKKSFNAPLVQSDQVDPITQQSLFLPFEGKSMAPSERSIIHAVFHPDLAGMNIAEFRRIAEVIEQGSVQHYQKFDYDGPTFTIDARLASDFARLLDSQNNWVFQGKSSLRLLVIWVNEDGETTIEEQEHSLRLSSSEMAALRNRYLTERLSSDPEFFEGCAVPVKLITLG